SCRDFIIDRLLLGQHINDWSWQSALIRCDYADASVDNDGDICMEPRGDVSDFSPPGFSRANQSLSAMLLCYLVNRRVNCPLARVDDRRNQLSWLAGYLTASAGARTRPEFVLCDARLNPRLSMLDGLRLLAGQLIGCHHPHRLTFDLASLLLGLARPGSPLDPQLQLATLASQLAREAAESSARLRLRRLYRRHACGYGDGEDDSKANFNVDSETENEFEPPWWRQLADHVGTMLSSLASCRKDLSHRPEASPHRQQAELKSPNSPTNYCRRDLLASLAGFANGDDCIDSISEQCYSAVVHQLDNWAAVTDAFANRLLTAYPALVDLSYSFLLGLALARRAMELRLARCANSCHSSSQVSHLCGAFPAYQPRRRAQSRAPLGDPAPAAASTQLLPALLRLGLLATAEPDPSARLAGAGRVLRDDLLPAFTDWQRRRLEREAQEESLYTYKEHSRLETRTTEEQFEADLRLAFPDFNDCYADLLTSTMTMTSDDEKAKSANEAKKDSEEFSDRDRLLLMCALQRAADGDRDGQLTARLADCCYRLLAILCSDAARDGRFLDPDADPKLLASHLRALTQPHRLGRLLRRRICSVRRLSRLSAGCAARRKLAERVMSFNVRDPANEVSSREWIWSCAELQRWEAVASHEVSLMTGAAPAVRRFIEWRGWSSNTAGRPVLDHCQWRFPPVSRSLAPAPSPAYSTTVLSPAQKCNASQLCQSLCQFLDRASLGDFSARLDCVGLLEAAYLPAVGPAARERRPGSSLSLRRVFVRLFDMNFWSVRASVDRSHRAVLKAVKQLEELLRESALSAAVFSLPESANHKSTNSDVDLSEGDERNFCHAVRNWPKRIRRLAPTSAASEAAAAVTSSVSGVAELCQRIVESSRQLRDMAPEQPRWPAMLLRGMHRRLAMTSTLTAGACTKELDWTRIERCDGFSLHLQRLLADLWPAAAVQARGQLRPARARCRRAAAAAPVTPRRRLSLRRLEAAATRRPA
uniref:DUF4509 domain-containing protein n=1 Tax=Macrostomum lignano TaxID=282301 RepID=A0A1I8FT28_9PLAT